MTTTLHKYTQKLTSPLSTLRYAYDDQRESTNITPLRNSLKQRSLRKLGKLTSKTPLSPRSTERPLRMASSSSSVAQVARKTAKRDDERENHILQELRRIIDAINLASEAFASLMMHYLHIDDAECEQELVAIAECVALDKSVTNHPKLKSLRLPSNEYLLEVGRAHVRLYLLRRAMSGGEQKLAANIVQTETELDSTMDLWIANCGLPHELLRDAASVYWQLEPVTDRPLSSREIGEQSHRMRRLLPIILIGALETLDLGFEAEKLTAAIVCTVLN